MERVSSVLSNHNLKEGTSSGTQFSRLIIGGAHDPKDSSYGSAAAEGAEDGLYK